MYSGHETFNMSMVVDRAAEQSGDRVVLHHFESEKDVTCREVAHVSNRVGNALRLLGVEIENRVAILMDDRPEWVYAFFGALKIGAVPTPLNTLLTEKDYAFFLRDSRAKVLFVDAPYMDKVEKIIPSLPYLKQVVLCNGQNLGQSGGAVVHWEAFIDGISGDLEVEPTSAGDVALFVYTSGSTGRPRAIMHPHGNYIQPSFNREGVYGIGEGATQFHIPKLYFLTSLGGVVVAFHTASSVVLLSGRPTPSTVLEVIARYQPNFLNGSPTIFARMVDHVKEAPHLADLSSVDYIFGTGEALSPR